MTTSTRHRIRQLLWLYFWLLIFEGALRKWIVPGLSSPLLLVRDPLALLALVWGWPLLQTTRWRSWLQPLQVIGPIAFLLAITVGHRDIPTALYGTRVLLLQFPLIFLYGEVFERRDVIRFARAVLWLAIPMTVLLAMQSNLPDSHVLNVGPGGIGTAAYQGALGRSRPPGTFSFISGVASFYSLAAASLFILLYDVRTSLRNRLLGTAAAIALVGAVPLSVSRSLLAGYLLVLATLIVALALSRTRLDSLLAGLLGLTIAVGIATTIPAFQDAAPAFLARWESSGAAAGVDRGEEGDLGIVTNQLQTRVLPGFVTPFSNLDAVPLLGYGIGMGSNVGAQRLSGQPAFLLGEGGLEATLGELGLLLGLAFLLWRLALVVWILRLSLQAAIRGNRLPLILTGCSALPLLSGQLSQPTALGFVVLAAGLNLAAFNGPVTPNPSSAPKAISMISPA